MLVRLHLFGITLDAHGHAGTFGLGIGHGIDVYCIQRRWQMVCGLALFPPTVKIHMQGFADRLGSLEGPAE